MKNYLPTALLACICAGMLTACANVSIDETRAHDQRTGFAPAPDSAAATFPELTNATTPTDRWGGVLGGLYGGAAYRIEVPKSNWNGKLVMYAHGYVGTDKELKVLNPPIRRHLIDNGYAWAASSFSKNYYDVRAGIEDTNALALAFTRIAAENGRVLAAPDKIYIVGRSMGGHIAAAAIEPETLASAHHKVRYDGALPLCGALGDTALADYMGAYQLAARQLAGLPAANFPSADWASIESDVRATLFNSDKSFTKPTAQGVRLKSVVMYLTGGPRPIFDEGFAVDGLQNRIWAAFASVDTLAGIVSKNVVNTHNIHYRFDAPQAVEASFNANITRATAAPDANAQRRDGLRWIPKINGEFSVPVLTLHTLGDMLVPFSMEQIYLQRATAKGNAGKLVQRAIRAPAHCDFTVAEQARAFADLVNWVERGVKPRGDDVLTAETLAQANYGCAFTDNSFGTDDDAAIKSARALGKLPSCRLP
ncbi:MAG: alpha/beta hydrolase [Rhodocyclaceae bacterium]|nr:alpha/beta hydrolase [Rhodocyclaceae bacterium]